MTGIDNGHQRSKPRHVQVRVLFLLYLTKKSSDCFCVFKVNEHLKDIMEQEQKLKEHHTVEAPGGQKVRVPAGGKGALTSLCVHVGVCLGWC